MKIRFVLIIAAATFLGAGCTTIPQKKFAAYREAFQAARAQSETVLADFAAARIQKEQLKKPAAAAAPANSSLQSVAAISDFQIDPLKPAEDAVQIRLAAWEVLAKYNEALAAVAAGVSQKEVEDSVNGFIGALKNFPINEVAKVGAEAAPYGAAISGIIQLIEVEVRARKFKDAVLKAEPPLRAFNKLLQEDAVKIYEVRWSLYENAHAKSVNEIVGFADAFNAILISHDWKPAAPVNGEIKLFNSLAEVSPGFRIFDDFKALNDAGNVAADRQEADLRDLRNIREKAAAKAGALRDNIRAAKAYHAMMTQYAALLRGFAEAQASLVEAAKSSSNQLPSSAQLQQLASNVRLAHQIYISSK
jgi:hypothetical protein